MTEPKDVCNAVMQFAELHRQKDQAGRVLMYPKSWNSKMSTDQWNDRPQDWDVTKDLLKLASDVYGVELHPVGPLLPDSNG